MGDMICMNEGMVHSHYARREFSRRKWEYSREYCFHTRNELFALAVYHNALLCLHMYN